MKKYKVNYDLFTEEDFLKNCPKNKFIPTILPPVKRIIAIGDIHGDLELAIESFKIAKLIDDKLNWIAEPKDTVVVQVGDQIDSCRPIPLMYDCHNEKQNNDKREDIKVLNFFDDMNTKALKKGGAVYSLIGNHEIMNSEGLMDYVSYDNYHEFEYKTENKIYKGPKGRENAFKPGGPLADYIACTRISILVIGSSLFVHAGVLPALATDLKYLNIDNEDKLRYLNGIVRKWLLHKLKRADKKVFKNIIDNMKISPFWTRIYGEIPSNINSNYAACDELNEALKVFKIGNLVIGHTPQMTEINNGINGTCYKNGKDTLYRVDGGFSRGFKIFDDTDKVQVLEILNDNEFNIISK